MVDETVGALFGSDADAAAQELAQQQAELQAEQERLEEEQRLKEEQLEIEKIRGLQGARRSPGGSSTSLG